MQNFLIFQELAIFYEMQNLNLPKLEDFGIEEPVYTQS